MYKKWKGLQMSSHVATDIARFHRACSSKFLRPIVRSWTGLDLFRLLWRRGKCQAHLRLNSAASHVSLLPECSAGLLVPECKADATAMTLQRTRTEKYVCRKRQTKSLALLHCPIYTNKNLTLLLCVKF